MKRLVFLSIILLPLTALSQNSPIVTDRPDQTEASSTVYPGAFQIESGFLFMTTDASLAPNAQNELYAWNTIWRIGLVERLELRVMTQPEIQRGTINGNELFSQGGLANLEVGFKVNIVQRGDGNTEVGFLSHLVTPTGTDGIANNNSYGSINKLAITHFISDRHTIAYNLGYDYLGFGNGDFFYSLVWGVGLSETLSVYIEPYGYVVNFDDWQASADAGFTYLFSDNLQFDYSFGLGLNHEMNYHSVGMSIRLPQ